MLGKEEIFVLVYVFLMSLIVILFAWAGVIEIGQ